MDGKRSFLDTHQAAAILLDRVAGPWDLARSRFAAQLGNEFHQLPNAGRTQRMALRLQPARGVDGDAPPSANSPRSAAGPPSPGAARPEAQAFSMLNTGMPRMPILPNTAWPGIDSCPCSAPLVMPA